ncbi:hypothetical protein PISMIDRAFT_14125 [Pisolithus microcarpus 441]|uniref:Unplaced genomic scaffold scaffold_113, whole genome shotgun sequence n=1 Tax=Pisolithus microcarpus 441 TaxID=765257 RepID=A0A0C9Y1X6_9AGAM|nr:hypothetical protein PISMIDRAFT_14125 [Pisolithus microcarpus 441]
MTLDVWNVVNRNETRPAGAAEQAKWDTKDNQGMGTILLYCDPVISVSLYALDTSKKMWDHLAGLYGAPTAVSAYTDFLHLMKIWVQPSDDLGSKLAEFNMILGSLVTQSIKFEEPVQCMLLCRAFSNKWGQGPTNILSLVATKDLKITEITARLKELSSHRSGQSLLPRIEQSQVQASSSQPLINRLSKLACCRKCRGKHLTEEHVDYRPSAPYPGRGRGNRGCGSLSCGGAPPQQQTQQSSRSRGKRHTRGRGCGWFDAMDFNEVNFEESQVDTNDHEEYSDRVDDYKEGGYESYAVEVNQARWLDNAQRFEEFNQEITPVHYYDENTVEPESMGGIRSSHSQSSSACRGEPMDFC